MEKDLKAFFLSSQLGEEMAGNKYTRPVFVVVVIAENIAETGEFLPCGFDGCPLRYCASCWQNLKHRCVVYYEKEGRAVV